MKKIIYIQRGDSTSALKRVVKSLQQKLEYFDQDGYFEAAIETIPGERTKRYSAVPKTQPEAGWYADIDAFVLNLKARATYGAEGFGGFFENVWSGSKANKALFINAAQAEYMLEDSMLDNFDVVFKREPFKDRDRYDISEENRAKIVPTMIHCPFVHTSRDNWLSKAYLLVRPKVQPCRPGEAVYDVGFSGADAAEHSLRRDVWQRVVDEGFSRIGGLQPNPVTKAPLPEALRGPRYKGRAYRNALCAAKINLALDGIGQYTFRHQELLYLGCFMMSGPSIRELELPMPLEEGKHYVAFDDLDDMAAKIRYYLSHEDERQQIATAGKALFDEYYNPERHGAEILAALKRVQR